MVRSQRVAWMLVLALGLVCFRSAEATRIKDLCDIQGARGNALSGIGLVVGLAGTGDKTPAAINAQGRMLDRLNIDVSTNKDLKSDNVAVVIVTATFPAFAKEGTRIDVQVSSIYDCKSLEGGTLLETLLYGIDKEVYAVGQGPVSVGGFNASGGGGTSVRKNHVTAGRVPMGAYIEREIPSTITDGQRIALLLKQPDFATANNIQQALNQAFGATASTALGAGTVQVTIPGDAKADLVGFIARVEDVSVNTGTLSRVVINERTGTIVVGGDIMVKPCQIAHGSLSIEIATSPVISQPGPFSEKGQTVATTTTDVKVKEQPAFLMPVQGTSAAEVASALNKLKVTPRDLIAIFQALRQAGALEADLEIM